MVEICHCGRTFTSRKRHVDHVHTRHQDYLAYVSDECHHGKHKRCPLTAPMGAWPDRRSGRCACTCHPWGIVHLDDP